jgi:hypothetical protein
MDIDFDTFYRHELCNKGIIHIQAQDALIIFNALMDKIDLGIEEKNIEIGELQKEIDELENELESREK